MSQHPSLTRERIAERITQTRASHAHGPLADRGHTRKYVAELIGTFLLVFLGTSAIVALGGPFSNGVATIGYIGIALAFGFTLVVLAYTLGPVSGGLAIGIALLAIHLAGLGFSSSGVNPARSIGPALFVGGTALSQLWVFILAPVVGGLIAAAVYVGLRLIQEAPATTEEEVTSVATSPA